MKATEHFQARCAQRGVTRDTVQMVIAHGTASFRPGGVVEYHLRRRDRDEFVSECKRCIRLAEKATDVAVVVASEGEIITTYHKVG